MLIVKIIENNTIYSVQELHLCLFLFSARVILAGFASSTVSVHSSTKLSTIFFPAFTVLLSKYSPTSHDLSHSHSNLYSK